MRSPTNVWVLFSSSGASGGSRKPRSAFRLARDRRARGARSVLKQNIPLVPLYTGTGVGTGTAFVSSDTYPGSGGVLGLTRSQIADAKARGAKPAGGAGFAYLRGPDDSLVEYQGNMPAERFNHIHMYQEQ